MALGLLVRVVLNGVVLVGQLRAETRAHLGLLLVAKLLLPLLWLLVGVIVVLGARNLAVTLGLLLAALPLVELNL